MKSNTPNTLIALLQLNLDSKTGNREKCAKWIEKAVAKGADIVCLPELYNSYYFCQSEDVDCFSFAEKRNGESFVFFSALAKKYKCQIIVPFFEKVMPGLYYNSVVSINEEGKEIGFYRKMHIPDDPLFYEKFYFSPGDLGYQCIKTKKLNYGLLICWDQWFSEAARLTALKGAETIFYPTAIGWHPKEKEIEGKNQLEAWKSVMKGHAVANGCYIAAANRIGLEKYVEGTGGIEFWGNSIIVDPQGVMLAEGSTDKEEILFAEIDRGHLGNVRNNWPFFRDRRVDSYGEIVKKNID